MRHAGLQGVTELQPGNAVDVDVAPMDGKVTLLAQSCRVREKYSGLRFNREAMTPLGADSLTTADSLHGS